MLIQFMKSIKLCVALTVSTEEVKLGKRCTCKTHAQCKSICNFNWKKPKEGNNPGIEAYRISTVALSPHH